MLLSIEREESHQQIKRGKSSLTLYVPPRVPVLRSTSKIAVFFNDVQAAFG